MVFGVRLTSMFMSWDFMRGVWNSRILISATSLSEGSRASMSASKSDMFRGKPSYVVRGMLSMTL